MFCIECGGKLTAEARFCGYCGEDVGFYSTQTSSSDIPIPIPSKPTMPIFYPTQEMPPTKDVESIFPSNEYIKTKSSTNRLLMGAVIAVLVLVVSFAVVRFFFLQSDDNSTPHANVVQSNIERYQYNEEQNYIGQHAEFEADLYEEIDFIIEEDVEQETAFIVVPDFRGASISSLLTEFEQIGLFANIEYFYDDNFDEDTVIWMSHVGDTALQGALIFVHVSLGAEPVLEDVPDIEEPYNSIDLLGMSSSSIRTASAARIHNISLAADAIRGTVLLPGDAFSYNRIVGPWTVQTGFVRAEGMLGGVPLTAVGSGVAQLASNIFDAVLQADLEVIERHQHQDFVEFMPLGREARVVHGRYDLRFRNNTEFSIEIDISISDYYVTVYLIRTN